MNERLGESCHTLCPADVHSRATDDQFGLVPDSVALYQDWTAAKKSAELHLYAKGGHGCGMCTPNLPSENWINLFTDWMGSKGLLKR